MDILRGLLGISVLLLILFLASNNRKAIDWRLVGVALASQIALGALIMYVDEVRSIFDFLSGFFVMVIEFTDEGAALVFGGLLDTQSVGYIFAVKVLPTIIFFSALSAILYYLGILQAIIYVLAWGMSKVMRLTGAESLAAAANVFIGQTEAPLIIKPYLDKMSKSELMCLMVGGMSTIAGGVLAAYIGFLGGDDPVARQEFATHLLTASIMSAPAAILAAKMLYPETSEDINRTITIPREQVGDNLLDAISKGTTDGLRLAVNVGAMLLVFTALMALLNSMVSGTVGELIAWSADSGSFQFFGGNDLPANTVLRWNAEAANWLLMQENNPEVAGKAFDVQGITLNMYIEKSTAGRFTGFNLEYMLGLLLSPIAWLLGTPSEDMVVIGQLLGKKTILNEFVAYADIPKVEHIISEKSKIIVTYALCGFANFASIGIQIGGIGAIAPARRKELSTFGVKALIGGTIACFLTATIAGMLIGGS